MEEVSFIMNQIYDISNEGYKIIDKNFNIVSCNKKYTEFNNLENKQDIIGNKCNEHLCSLNCGTEKCSLIQILKGKKTVETTIEKKTESNEIKYFFLVII